MPSLGLLSSRYVLLRLPPDACQAGQVQSCEGTFSVHDGNSSHESVGGSLCTGQNYSYEPHDDVDERQQCSDLQHDGRRYDDHEPAQRYHVHARGYVLYNL